MRVKEKMKTKEESNHCPFCGAAVAMSGSNCGASNCLNKQKLFNDLMSYSNWDQALRLCDSKFLAKKESLAPARGVKIRINKRSPSFLN